MKTNAVYWWLSAITAIRIAGDFDHTSERDGMPLGWRFLIGCLMLLVSAYLCRKAAKESK